MSDPKSASLQSYEPGLAPHFAKLLSQREDELLTLLKTLDYFKPGEEMGHEVSDFKDMADEQTHARLDKANAQRLEAELRQVANAQRRLAENRYGTCLDCGEAIDLRRLTALPATPFCAACQAQHEGARLPRHRAY